MGMYLSRVVIPEFSKAVDQGDVDMADEDDIPTSESGTRSNRKRASGTRCESRRHRRDESPNDSETSGQSTCTIQFQRQHVDAVLSERSQNDRDNRVKPHVLLPTTSSSGSGAAQVAMNVLHQTRLARMRIEQDRRLETLEERQESFLVRQHQAQLDVCLVVDCQLQSALRGVEALARRLANMESRRQHSETTPSVEDQPPASLDTGRTQSRVQKYAEEATRRERKRFQAEYEERW
ncbi:LOW QUALITY PROTEIN: hypothetical protein PHMEG_00010976 [Phytophthora megakarya]|uniref:Uncharacterized protein n=1 Tax=Phytophthora megakarya TaxID=4795 RepID=A0A225WCD3_9STRA|nr:LOW QUALITY PROTEIN: hypothetical protein PHMEG_00010976 [Phytophthora megakarya]